MRGVDGCAGAETVAEARRQIVTRETAAATPPPAQSGNLCGHVYSHKRARMSIKTRWSRRILDGTREKNVKKLQRFLRESFRAAQNAVGTDSKKEENTVHPFWRRSKRSQQQRVCFQRQISRRYVYLYLRIIRIQVLSLNSGGFMSFSLSLLGRHSPS